LFLFQGQRGPSSQAVGKPAQRAQRQARRDESPQRGPGCPPAEAPLRERQPAEPARGRRVPGLRLCQDQAAAARPAGGGQA